MIWRAYVFGPSPFVSQCTHINAVLNIAPRPAAHEPRLRQRPSRLSLRLIEIQDM